MRHEQPAAPAALAPHARYRPPPAGAVILTIAVTALLPASLSNILLHTTFALLVHGERVPRQQLRPVAHNRTRVTITAAAAATATAQPIGGPAPPLALEKHAHAPRAAARRHEAVARVDLADQVADPRVHGALGAEVRVLVVRERELREDGGLAAGKGRGHALRRGCYFCGGCCCCCYCWL